MFTDEQRDSFEINVRNPHHLFKRFTERGNKLFGNISSVDMYSECISAIADSSTSAIVEDARSKDSTHHCIFITNHGGYVCLPLKINGKTMTIITMMPVHDDAPLWFIRQYNKIAASRALPLMGYDLCK